MVPLENAWRRLAWKRQLFVAVGAIATDYKGADLTARIVTCPPADCLTLGCIGHEFVSKGIQGCGVDTAAAKIGTAFNVTFSVWDTQMPAQRSSATRFLQVISPCSATDTYCPGLSQVRRSLLVFVRCQFRYVLCCQFRPVLMVEVIGSRRFSTRKVDKTDSIF